MSAIGRSSAQRAAVVRDALLALERDALAEANYVEALYLERLAATAGDARLARLARMIAE